MWSSTKTGTFKALFGFIPLFAAFFFDAPKKVGVRIARSIIPSVFSLISTQALIHFGARGLSQFQASTCLAAGVVFSYYAILSPSQDCNRTVYWSVLNDFSASCETPRSIHRVLRLEGFGDPFRKRMKKPTSQIATAETAPLLKQMRGKLPPNSAQWGDMMEYDGICVNLVKLERNPMVRRGHCSSGQWVMSRSCQYFFQVTWMDR